MGGRTAAEHETGPQWPCARSHQQGQQSQEQDSREAPWSGSCAGQAHLLGGVGVQPGVVHATTTELGHLPMRIRHAQLTWEGAFLNLGALGPGLALHMASGWDPAWTRERTHMRLLVRIPSARHTVHSGDKLLTNLKDSQLVQCSSRVPQLRKYAGRVSRMFGARRSVGLNQSADFKMLTSAVNEERARAVGQQQSILNIKQWNLPPAFQTPSLRCRGPSSPTLLIPGRVGEWRQQHLRGMPINRRWMLMIR